MWGSDLIAEAISDLGFEFAAINPGASYRGLHDSFVNYLDNRLPLLVCLHEENAVALAHGWAKVTERPALAIVHSNVGLMHAIMPIYNAWVDRAPVVVLNATGPLDASSRRPWIEWIHTSQDHGALVRNFTKWDDLPTSPSATVDALAEAKFLAGAEPKGPTFVCMDVGAQEQAVTAAYRARALPQLQPIAPDTEGMAAVARQLIKAERIVILAGRTSRSEAGWADRIALAERFNAAVILDVKTPAAFPSTHMHVVSAPGYGLDPLQQAVLDEADAIIALDWIDLDNVLCRRKGKTYVVAASLDHAAARGWVKNTYRQAVTDARFPVVPEALVSALLAALPEAGRSRDPWWTRVSVASVEEGQAASLGDPAYSEIALGLARVRAEMPASVTRYPLGWPAALATFEHPLDYLGRDGGEGLASGPGIAVGVALALKGTGRLPVAIIGDGDFVMGISALWTAASEKLPLLVVVAANGVYGNDVVHQERVARLRNRAVTNKWVGQRIDGPRIDLAGVAGNLGAVHAERVSGAGAADAIFAGARRAIANSGPVLIEVEIPAS